MAPAIPPTGEMPPRPQPNVRNDYRSMVEAIQAGDISTAHQAFSRITRGLPSSATDGSTTLGKIGALIDKGDLKSAQGILDGLESKAMKVLREVQRVTERDKSDPTPPRSTFRLTI
jgi:hypothetical protein